MGFFDGVRRFFHAPKAEDIDNGTLKVDIDEKDEHAVTADELTAFIIAELEKRRQDRLSLELQWLLNANFVSGHQYCEIHPTRGEVVDIEAENDTEERGVYNRIAPIYDTRMANLRNVRYAMTVRPATAEDDDVEKAAISTDLLRYAQRKLDWEGLKTRIYDWSELCGTAFILSYWNPEDGEIVGHNEDGTPICEGDLACGLLTPYEVFPESIYKETIEDQRSIITDQVLHVSEIYERYGVRVDGRQCDKYVITPISGAGGYGSSTFQSTVMATKTTKVSDSEHCITYYERPTKKYPTGRLAVIVGESLVHYGPLPFDGVPIVAVKCKTVAGQFFGKSYIQDMIPLQRAYNGCKNALHAYIRASSGEPLLVPEGSIKELDYLINNGITPNQVVTYDPEYGTPSRLKQGDLPTEIINEINQLVADMEYTAGISQLMIYGAAPSGVSSGTAIEHLRQIDNTRLSLTAENMREAVKKLALVWLHIYKRYAAGYRVSNVVGTNQVGRVFVWCAEEINSDDVVFDTVNELILSEDRQRENFLQAYQMGLFADENGVVPREFREKAIELMRLGNFTQLMTLTDHQRANASRENDFLQAGVIPQRYQYDDDTVHIEEHTRFALQYRFRRFRNTMPALAQAFDNHIKEHKNALAREERQKMATSMALKSRMTSPYESQK